MRCKELEKFQNLSTDWLHLYSQLIVLGGYIQGPKSMVKVRSNGNVQPDIQI